MEASSKNTIGVHTPPRFVSKQCFSLMSQNLENQN